MHITLHDLSKKMLQTAFAHPPHYEFLSLTVLDGDGTSIGLRNPSTGAVTRIYGSNLSTIDQLYDEYFTGTITGWETRDASGHLFAEVSTISWRFSSFVLGLYQAFTKGNELPLLALFETQAMTVDASPSSTPFTSKLEEALGFTAFSSAVTIIGTGYADVIHGGMGHDTITLGQTPNGEQTVLYASSGNDHYDFSRIQSDGGAVILSYAGWNQALTIEVYGLAQQGSIRSLSKSDTLASLTTILDHQAGGLTIIGSALADQLSVHTILGQRLTLQGGAGADHYQLTLGGDIILDFFGDHSTPVTNAVVINLTTKVISNDGYGNVESLDIIDAGGKLTLRGSAFSDHLIGSDQRFEIYQPEGGNDTIDGRGGADLVDYDSSLMSSGVHVDLNTGSAIGQWNNINFTQTLLGIEHLRGTAEGNDTLIGDHSSNRLEGLGGDDYLVTGRGGHDTLIGGNGSDIFVIQTGSIARIEDFDPNRDRIDLSDWLGLKAIDQLVITSFLGVLSVQYAQEILYIAPANGISLTAQSLTPENMIGLLAQTPPPPSIGDLPNAGAIQGTEGVNETLTGTDGHDVIFAHSGNNKIFGGAGNDTLYAGSGNDSLDGGSGANVLVGGVNHNAATPAQGANTRFVVRSEHDLVINEFGYSQGGGINTVEAWVDYVLPRNVQILRLQGSEDLKGSGNAAPEAIVGNNGNNLLSGNGGNDVINGKSGNDTLCGGSGADTLIGEEGFDTFLFRSISESGVGQSKRDFINGFENGIDKIDLSQIDANTTLPGHQSFIFIHSEAFSGRAGELRFFSWGGNNYNIVEVDVNGDSQADMQIFINLTPAMFEGDFIL